MKALFRLLVFILVIAVVLWAAFSGSEWGGLAFWGLMLSIALFRTTGGGARPIDTLAKKLRGCIRHEDVAI
jgi:hypothetical protein